MARSLRPPHKLPVFIFHYCMPKTCFNVSSAFSLRAKPSVLLMAKSSSYHSFKYQYVRGFICCSSPRYDMVTVYNPTTRECVPLPKIKSMAVYNPTMRQRVSLPKIKPMVQSQKRHCYFGYDNVMNQYKVLALVTDSQELTQTFHVFTLGRYCHQWRKIQGNIDEKLFPIDDDEGVCIDGIIYYGAMSIKEGAKYGEAMLLSFDVRSERFYHVLAPPTLLKAIRNWSDRKPFNHMGKLGWICRNENNASMWIMENAKKQEWSDIITFGLPEYEQGDFVISSGVTPAGDIFVVKRTTYPHEMPLYVHYYNIKQKSFRKVEIEGARTKTTKAHTHSVRVFPIHDYVENTMRL